MANSVAESLGDATAAIVAGLALKDDANAAVAVVQRKTPGLREGEAPPVACVCVDEDDFEPATADDAKAWFGYYTVTVVFVQRKTAVQAGADKVREWRQKVRRAVTLDSLPANGALNVDDCDPVARPTFDAAALDSSYDYSPVQFHVRTLEPRS